MFYKNKGKLKKITLTQGDVAFYQYDAMIGFWGRPNIERDVYFKNKNDNFIRVRHNRFGNRDKSIADKKKGAILCFGGSHTWGAGIEEEERYTEYLEKITKIPVFNIGHCSLGLDQICLAVLNMAEYYQPSIIIIEQYPWAIHRVLSAYVNGYCKPYFYIDNEGKLSLNKMPKLSSFSIFRRIIGRYYSYRKEFNEFKGGIDLKNAYDPWGDPIFLYWKTHYYDYMYSLVDNIVGVVQDFCMQRNIKLLFSLQAIMQQFGHESPSALIDYELPKKRLMAIFEKKQIPAIDNTSAMLAEHSSDKPVIFSDGHMNEKGHRIFGQEIIKYLEERQWLSI